MRKLLYIAPHRQGRSPGQRFRFEQFMDYLTTNGVQITYSYLLNENDDKHFYSKGNYLYKIWIAIKGIFVRFFDVMRASKYDCIIVYREAHFLGFAWFEWALSKFKATMIFDFDDAIWLNDVSESNKNLKWLKSAAKTRKIAQYANVVTVGNSFLAEYAQTANSNVVIIPTVIDTNVYTYNEPIEKEVVTIGWIGSLTTWKHFQEAIPVLVEIKKRYGTKVDFKVIVDDEFVIPELGIVSTKWSKETELSELKKVDIGIMPLPNDNWSKGKCGFKGIQYMSLGIATIMSPVGVNVDIINNGVNGFLAETKEEWIARLSQLIVDRELRKSLGSEARKTIVKNFSVISQQTNLLAIVYG